MYTHVINQKKTPCYIYIHANVHVHGNGWSNCIFVEILIVNDKTSEIQGLFTILVCLACAHCHAFKCRARLHQWMHRMCARVFCLAVVFVCLGSIMYITTALCMKAGARFSQGSPSHWHDADEAPSLPAGEGTVGHTFDAKMNEEGVICPSHSIFSNIVSLILTLSGCITRRPSHTWPPSCARPWRRDQLCPFRPPAWNTPL